MSDKRLAEAMRAAREAGGYVMEDFATDLGVRIGSISRWETLQNEGEPDRGTKILHYFVALLTSRPEVRDRLLAEIGAVEGTLRIDDPEALEAVLSETVEARAGPGERQAAEA